MAKTPRPFISHAHADKERFVLEFARRLRSKGIDAWVDSWEMLPGDSLVDKIFNEGLKSVRLSSLCFRKEREQQMGP